MSARNSARAAGRMTLMTGWQRQCTSQTVGLHAVNFKRFNARRRAGWVGRQGDCLVVDQTIASLVFHAITTTHWYLGNADCHRCRESVVTTQLLQATPCVPTPPAAATAVVSPSLRCTQSDDHRICRLRWVRWNGRMDRVWISVIREWRPTHFSLILRDGNFPTRIVS